MTEIQKDELTQLKTILDDLIISEIDKCQEIPSDVIDSMAKLHSDLRQHIFED
jgi:hypothetical protein